MLMGWMVMINLRLKKKLELYTNMGKCTAYIELTRLILWVFPLKLKFMARKIILSIIKVNLTGTGNL